VVGLTEYIGGAIFTLVVCQPNNKTKRRLFMAVKVLGNNQVVRMDVWVPVCGSGLPTELTVDFYDNAMFLTATGREGQRLLTDLKLKLVKTGVPVIDPDNRVEEGGEQGPVDKLIFKLRDF
jgi:hypothetical protein